MKKLGLLLCLAALPTLSCAQSGFYARGNYGEFKPVYANDRVKLKAYGGGLGVRLHDLKTGVELISGLDYHTGNKASKLNASEQHQLDSAWQLTLGSRYPLSSAFYLLTYTSILYYRISSETLQAGKWQRQRKAFSGHDLTWGLGLGLNISQSIGIEASSTVLNKHKIVNFGLIYTF